MRPPEPGLNWRGNAGTWLENAKAQGWQTTVAPTGAEVGAIMVWTGNLGHVGVVTRGWNGGFEITEMNMGALDPVRGYPYTVNFGKWTTRQFTVSNGLDRYGANGEVTLIFSGFILPRKAVAVDLSQQALADLKRRSEADSRFSTLVNGTFGIDPNWDPSFELRWVTFGFTWSRRVTIYHATYKQNPGVRFTIFYDPDRRAWTNWEPAK